MILSPGHKVGNMESVGIVKISNKKTRHNSHRQYVPPMAKIILKTLQKFLHHMFDISSSTETSTRYKNTSMELYNYLEYSQYTHMHNMNTLHKVSGPMIL